MSKSNTQLIVDIAWKLFQEKGYKGVSIDELCQESNLSKPTLYYYFKNKEILFVSVLHYKLQSFHLIIDAPGTFKDRLENVSLKILETFQYQYMRLMDDQKYLKDPNSIKTLKNAFYDNLFFPISQLIQIGINNNQIEPQNPEVLTLLFLGSINNFIGQAHRFNKSNQELASIITNYFLQGASKK